MRRTARRPWADSGKTRVQSSAVPRHRTARTAVLGVSVRRPVTGKPPSRATSVFRRRVVVGVLVVLALVLITFSFRQPDDGPVASAQRGAAAAMRPFTIAGERAAQPFRDAYGWGSSLLTARSDAKRLREENATLRQQAIQNQFASNENDKLKELLAFRDGPRFPGDYTGLAAAVIARPTGGFAQEVVVAAGSNDGVTLDAPVVSADGFLGRVTRVYTRSARVTLLTDEQLAVSALDVKTGAAGIVKHGRASASTLIFDRVPKKLRVSVGDTIVTAGWRSSKLASLYPRGIPIGRVTSVGQADTDLWKQVQVEPFADFDRIDVVLVLVRKQETP